MRSVVILQIEGLLLMATQSARANGGTTAWRKIRARILARDGWTCQYCGNDEHALMTVDHVIPISKGGTDEDSNLISACQRCNYSKGNRMGLSVCYWISDSIEIL